MSKGRGHSIEKLRQIIQAEYSRYQDLPQCANLTNVNKEKRMLLDAVTELAARREQKTKLKEQVDGLARDLRAQIDALQKQLRLAQMQNFDHESAIGCLERDYEDMQDERDDLAIMVVEMRSIFERMVNPIGYLQDECKRLGHQLDGAVAIQIADSPSWYQGWAREALGK